MRHRITSWTERFFAWRHRRLLAIADKVTSLCYQAMEEAWSATMEVEGMKDEVWNLQRDVYELQYEVYCLEKGILDGLSVVEADVRGKLVQVLEEAGVTLPEADYVQA